MKRGSLARARTIKVRRPMTTRQARYLMDKWHEADERDELHPCIHGHAECSFFHRGPCTDEACDILRWDTLMQLGLGSKNLN